MNNILKQNLSEYIKVVSKYLTTGQVDKTYKVCMKLNNNSDISEKSLYDVEYNILHCFQKISGEIFHHKNYDDFTIAVEDEIKISDFMLKISKLSKFKINYQNKLSDIIDWLSRSMIDPNINKLDEERIDYYIDRKKSFFNGLDSLGQDWFNIQYLYLNVLTICHFNKEKPSYNIILYKLLNLLKEIKVNDEKMNAPKFDVSSKLIKILKSLSKPNEEKEICYEMLKIINFDAYFSVKEYKIFNNAILDSNVKFFEDLFNSYQEMNHFRVNLSLLSMDIGNLDMFDYFLNKEYISELNKIKRISNNVRMLKKKKTWIDHKITTNIHELDDILVKIFTADEKEMFLKIFLMKKYENFKLLPFQELIYKHNLLKNGKTNLINLNVYLNFIKPLLTKEILIDSIQKLNSIKTDSSVDNDTFNLFNKSLLLLLDNFNKVKKINSIKLKR